MISIRIGLIVYWVSLVWAGNATFADMRKCLVSGGVAKQYIIGRGEKDYGFYNYQWNLRIPQMPGGYLEAQTTKDIQTAVKCAASVGYPITVRGGGHSYEGYSVISDRLVIDLTALDDIKLKGDYAVIGAGLLLGNIYGELWKLGKRSVPAGTCPTVGVSGHTLGGGYGLSSRKHGLMVDQVVSMQVVDAKGNLLKVTHKKNPDLFYALRGAGMDTFGIVTQFTMKTFDASKPVYVVSLSYTPDRMVEVLSAWQNWAKSGPPDSVTAVLYLSAPHMIMNAVVEGSRAMAETVLAAFPALFQQDIAITQMSYIDMIVQFGDPKYFPDLNSVEHVTKRSLPKYYFKAKSMYINELIPEQGLKSIVKAIREAPDGSIALFDLQGGVIATPPTQDAFIHRHNLYSVQIINFSDTVEEGKKADPWVDLFWNALLPYYSGYSYQDYIDNQLSDPLQRYYGYALPKLEKIKRHRDPTNLFNNPLSIPLR